MRIRMRSDKNGNKAAPEKNGPDIYFIYKQKYSFKLFSYLNIHKYYCSVLWSESVVYSMYYWCRVWEDPLLHGLFSGTKGDSGL